MNGRYVRLKPSVDFQSVLTAARVLSTLAKSTSTTLNAWGVTDFDITMWAPVSWRIFDSLTTSSRGPTRTAGGAAAATGVGAGATGAWGAGAGCAAGCAAGAGCAGAGCAAGAG
jgi:hypothetical protein